MILSPNEERLSLIFISNESMTVKTEIMAKIPMVIPRRESMVLSLLIRMDLNAKKKLSIINLMTFIINF
jgi:hypothetical protein